MNFSVERSKLASRAFLGAALNGTGLAWGVRAGGAVEYEPMFVEATAKRLAQLCETFPGDSWLAQKERLQAEGLNLRDPGSLPTTKTARLLHSFSSVELRPEHRNYGDQGPFLRDYGFSAVVAAKLIAWGEDEDLVCTFEDGAGRSDGCHCWTPAFLVEACARHLEKYGPDDLPEGFRTWCAELREEGQCLPEQYPRP